MPSMETPFMTIADACDKTGRSASTIRRLIKSIADDDSHPDRSAIEPAPKEVAAFKKKGENFTWRIREDVLLREFKGALKEAKKEVSEAKGDILDILQKELELKNHQIEKQWEVIHALNDRLREGNILMGSLQKRLALPLGDTPADNVVDSPALNSSSKDSKETATASAGKQGKKRILRWFR